MSCNGTASCCCDRCMAERDRPKTRAEVLQERIDEAIEMLEYPTAEWSEMVPCVLDVLKGVTKP